jgi:hypothetical protein
MKKKFIIVFFYKNMMYINIYNFPPVMTNVS